MLWLWLASGLAFAVILPGIFLFVPHGTATIAITFALITVMHAHTASPIVLAWSHKGFRQIIWQRPLKYIGGPSGVLMIGAATALATWWAFPLYLQTPMSLYQDFYLSAPNSPMAWLIGIYALWNLYHAGAQNFGMFSILGGRRYRGRIRWFVLIAIVCTTLALVYIPYMIVPLPVVLLFSLGLVTVHHWASSIGISAYVHGRHYGVSPAWFIVGVLLLGLPWAWLVVNQLYLPLWGFVLLGSMRSAYGICHFLYDRWIWKLGDPQVRATIGKELFA